MVVVQVKVQAFDEKMMEPEIRRFSIDNEEVTSFAALIDKIKGLFPDLQGKEFEIFWIDDELDQAILSNDEELLEAVRVTAAKDVLHILVNTVMENDVRAKQEACQESRSDEAVFECPPCDNEKLCSECKQNEVHREQRMEPSKKPYFCGRHRKVCHFHQGVMGTRGCMMGGRGGMMGGCGGMCGRGRMMGHRGCVGGQGGMMGPRGGIMGPRGGIMGGHGGIRVTRGGMGHEGIISGHGGIIGPRGMMSPRECMMGGQGGVTGGHGGIMSGRGGMMGGCGGMVSGHGGMMGGRRGMMGGRGGMMGGRGASMMFARGCMASPREEVVA